jgi:simple sugar transport system permease protein
LLFGALIALLIGAILIGFAGADPLPSYRVMIQGAFGGRRQVTETVLKAGPLLIIALGLAVAFRARVWNIGAEGQFFIGALCGGFVALQFPALPQAVLTPAILVAGLLGGALWGAIPALLLLRRGINEIIATLMLNYIAVLLVQYMARGPLRDPNGFLPESALLGEAARMPIVLSPRIHLGILLALALIPLVYVLLWRTPLGFRLRMIGSNAKVARFAGVNVSSGIFFALVFSGALAGLAGIIEVSTLHMRIKGAISGGYGFSAILVALLGRMHPVGILFASIFFAALSIGAESMHTVSGLPAALSQVIQALIVLFVLGADAYFRLKRT